ncbi:hypothetical protein DICSQDRAFT_69770 [Dichomitus squalens LYAD-421 SS1]|uniref:Peptidase S28 n=1 Tax=Dichomitus squalens (strain LYAD-421) TaxID=732165 RepID=R7SN53_DICSQ|nr:uncharacterized protein DICSQDRAFT_69770 [Dichomitus squalens LYAD-421 SS1]EJF57333.1 hypothetical protein DICSQDRAFT_69770 [Dichomitus squalens LYAD-421 SS1]
MFGTSSLVTLVLLLSSATALPSSRAKGPTLGPPRPSIPHLENFSKDIPVLSRNGTQLPAYSHAYYFDQLIDHMDLTLGTFKQRYYHTYEFYQPGGPIILMTPGEEDAFGYIGYLTNTTINGHLAQELNGSTIVLEHRFFGDSNPYDNLSVQSFRVHTVQQAIDDLVYFAQNVQLPMLGGDQVAPGNAPWVLIGGSYAGALTSYTLTSRPGVFTAGYASSAVVQAISDFWGYFEPIRQYMPANCSADVEAVIAHVDSVIQSNDTAAITALKMTFGLQGLAHNDDFAAARIHKMVPMLTISLMQQNLFSWQSLQPDSGLNQAFYQFCDALEVINSFSAPASGWGLDYALQAWGAYWTSTYYKQICGDDDDETCLGTYDSSSPFWTYTYTGNAERSWQWLLCTQFGFQFDGAPASQPTIASRIVTPAWGERQCGYRFPGAFGYNATASPDAAGLNSAYKGWDTTAEHLIFASGTRDPWREATVAADGATNIGSDLQPHLLSDGFHCSDLLIQETAASPQTKSVQDIAVSYITQWISEWKPSINKQSA